MADKKDESVLSRLLHIILMIVLILIAIAVAAFVITSITEYGSFTFDLNILSSSKFLSIFGIGGALLILFYLLFMSDDGGLFGFGKGGDKGAKVKAKGDISKYYDTNWLTKEQLRRDPQFKYHTYDTLSKSDNIGIPIRAELIGKTMHVNMYKSIHTLVIGTTGSGKTTQFVDPTMQILSESNARPCLVITDPKGEIYDNHSKKLRERGYRVLVFDLKDPFQSTCWNPMTRAYDLNQRAMNLEKEVKVHHNDDPRSFGLKCTSKVFYNEWYEFDGFAFADKQTLEQQLRSEKTRLKNVAFEDLRDIAGTLCPIQSNNDPIWERGAKDLVLGTMLAMLEDSEIPELGMTRERYNFFNLSRILNLKDNDQNPIKSLTEYFQGRDPLSLATQLANQVVTNAEKTAKSYMGIVTDRMGVFTDSGICYATSINEMELETFCDQPTALFIKIPDEKVTRHSIATMFISQLYKILVDVANKRGGALKRDVYFLLDEFANLPKIENFETIITVARSRRIYFTLVLQSYAQLAIKYGQDVSATVKDNCNIHVFIASNDQSTLEEFSKRCGNISVETESINVSKNKGGEEGAKEGSSTTTSVQLDTRPLIYPAELAALKPFSGECIVSILQQNPIRSMFTPSYKAQSVYKMEKAQDGYKIPNPIDEKEMYYDIRIRNQKMVKKNQPQGMGGGSGMQRPQQRPMPNNYPQRPMPNNYPQRPMPNQYPQRPMPNNYPQRPTQQ